MYQLVIADDEQIECRALEYKIQELVTGVTLLPSVYDGLSLIKAVENYHPDIAIVDINMPGLSGLEAIEMLKLKNADLKIIINTSYSDFAYIQKALQLGASDYLLKPGNKKVMAQAIEKVCRELDEERRARWERERDKRAVDSLYQVAAEKWLLSLLLGKEDENCYRLLAENCPEVGSGGVFCAWKIVLGEGKLLPVMEGPGKLLMTQMSQLCGCMGLEYEGVFYLFLMMDRQAVGEENREYVTELLEYGWSELKKAGYEACVGVSRLKEEKTQYIGGLYEARVSMQERNRPGIYFFRYRREEKRKALWKELIPDSAGLLSEGKIEECISGAVEELSKIKIRSTEDMEYLRIQAAAYLVALEQSARTLSGRQEGIGGSFIMWKDYNSIADCEGAVKWLRKGITNLWQTYFTEPAEENHYIVKALIYIYENSQKDISLEDAAELLGISSFYLSRLFKQEKNTTFVELLTDIRMRKAVRMMCQGDKTLREICQSTGYSSMTYFYRVFKKTTGFTVGEMKKFLIIS